MKYFPLLWAGLWRRRSRTALNLLSILFAFALFGVLQGFSSLLANTGKEFKGNRLMVLSRTGGFQGNLPLADLPQIEQVPGVVTVTYRNLFVGTYQHSTDNVLGFGIDPSHFFIAATEYKVTPQAIADLEAARRNMLADARLMEKYHWKIGDRISLNNANDTTSGDGAGNWAFDLVGSFTMDTSANSPAFLFNNDYYDQARVLGKGTVGWFDVVTTDASLAYPVSHRIDAIFANSPDQTETKPLYEFVQESIKQVGDIDYIIHAILSVVFFVLLASVGSVMMRAIRERTPELAVLKTIGFTDGMVAALLYGENLLLALTGAVSGIAASTMLLPVMAKLLQTNLAALPLAVPAEALALAVIFALAVGFVPARQASRLSIVDALGGH